MSTARSRPRRLSEVSYRGPDMANRIDLDGRFAVVTGGAQGIGRAITERFLDSGATVAIWDRDARLGAKVAQDLVDRGHGIIALNVDVADHRSVERARDETLKAFPRIDILVNNAGIGGPIQDTCDYPVDAWRNVMAVNLDGPFYCCGAVIPQMVANKYGRIVNIASVAGKEGNPRMAAYSASKAGLISLTKSLGKELATHDIGVNCITPSSAKTELLKQFTPDFVQAMLAKVPRGRFVLVEEI